MRQLYKYLKWLWAALLLGGVVLPLTNDCLKGLVLGKGCTPWQPALNFLSAYGIWVGSVLLALIGLTFLARRDERRHQEREKAQERLQEARKSFDLLKPATELSPEDLNFRVAGPGEAATRAERPFNECVYVPRIAAPYDQRGKENPQPRQDEEALVRSLQKNGAFNGFLLLGSPLDGKSRTLYEIVRGMEGYDILKPHQYGSVPDDEDFSLLLKDRRVVLLLDDLTKYAEDTAPNLREFAERLGKHASSWAVAATCRDGPELSAVRDAEKQSLRWFYDEIPLKLFLLQASPEDKRRLAESIGKAQNEGHWEEFPSLGHIAMEEPMKEMKARFGRLIYEQQDVLRGLKLLASAGILPYRRDRIKAVLECEDLFERRDLRLRDQLRSLEEQSFLSPGNPDSVQPEPAYLRFAVAYTSHRDPEDDFDALAGVLEGLGDVEGCSILETLT